jgi:FkbM family methyltransferase
MKLKTFIKRKIIQIIKKTGYELVGKKPIVKHNNFNAIIKFLIKELYKIKNPIIFDVGANVGQSIERFSSVFKNEEFKIYSFEPTPKLFQILKNKYDLKKNIKLFQLALDDKIIKSKFFSYEYDRINSLIQTDENSKFHKSRQIASKNRDFSNFETEIEVQTSTIDNIANEQNINKIDVLKIDTQGNEDRVLEGSKKLLNSNKINLIELELILGFGYQRQMSFLDIEKVLSPYGYRLIGIDYASNIIGFSNYQVNLIYVNSELFDKIKHLHYENKEIKDITNRTDVSNPFSY